MLFSSFRTPLFIPEYFILSNVIASRLPLCTIDLVEEWTSMKFDQASYVVYIKHVLTLFSQIYSSAWKCFRIYILEALNKIGCKWMWTKRELFSSAKPPSNNTLFYANYDKCEKKTFSGNNSCEKGGKVVNPVQYVSVQVQVSLMIIWASRCSCM